jgi:hypothetical protein
VSSYREMVADARRIRAAYLAGETADLGGLISFDITPSRENVVGIESGKRYGGLEPESDDVSPVVDCNLETADIPSPKQILDHPHGNHAGIHLIELCGLYGKCLVAGGATRSHFDDLRHGDIDIYVHESADIEDVISRITRYASQDKSGAVVMKRTDCAVTIDIDNIYQVIIATYTNVSQLLYLFDIPACQVATDGQKYYCTPLFLWQVSRLTIMFDQTAVSVNYDHRLAKMAKYGYRILFPNYRGESGERIISIMAHDADKEPNYNGNLYISNAVSMASEWTKGRKMMHIFAAKDFPNDNYAADAIVINECLNAILAGKCLFDESGKTAGLMMRNETADIRWEIPFYERVIGVVRSLILERKVGPTTLPTPMMLHRMVMAADIGRIKTYPIYEMVRSAIKAADPDARTNWYGKSLDTEFFPPELDMMIGEYVGSMADSDTAEIDKIYDRHLREKAEKAAAELAEKERLIAAIRAENARRFADQVAKREAERAALSAARIARRRVLAEMKSDSAPSPAAMRYNRLSDLLDELDN